MSSGENPQEPYLTLGENPQEPSLISKENPQEPPPLREGGILKNLFRQIKPFVFT